MVLPTLLPARHCSLVESQSPASRPETALRARELLQLLSVGELSSLVLPQVLRIDTNLRSDRGGGGGGGGQAVTLLSPPDGVAMEDLAGCKEWKWHGGVLAEDGCIYACPANATSVLRIDVAAQTLTAIGDSSKLQGECKWYGALKSDDGNIYGVPQNADAVLKIVPATQEVLLVGKDHFEFGGWKWHGGVYSSSDRCVYGVPNRKSRWFSNFAARSRADPHASSQMPALAYVLILPRTR